MWKGQRQSRLGIKKTIVSLAMIALGCILLGEGIKGQIGPNLDAVSGIKAKAMVSEIVNQTIGEEFSGQEEKDLVFVEKGKDGGIRMVQADTGRINRLIADLAENLQKQYRKMSPQEVDLSYGTLLGSKILSQMGFGLTIKILPLSVASYDFETEFETQGINQTKYKVYIVLESNVRILQPFSDKDLKIRNKILLSEVVILGDVPDSYINVPKEDILDVTE